MMHCAKPLTLNSPCNVWGVVLQHWCLGQISIALSGLQLEQWAHLNKSRPQISGKIMGLNRTILINTVIVTADIMVFSTNPVDFIEPL
jgi:hypothetical protein